MKQDSAPSSGLNRAKPYQLVLFPLNNGATNVYYVLILSYVATFGSAVLGLAIAFASIMVTAMRVLDAVTDPIIGALMDRASAAKSNMFHTWVPHIQGFRSKKRSMYSWYTHWYSSVWSPRRGWDAWRLGMASHPYSEKPRHLFG